MASNSLLDWLFGQARQPARPPSTGALLGLNYRGLPSSQNVDDRRQQPFDYPYSLQNPSWEDIGFTDINSGYRPSMPFTGNNTNQWQQTALMNQWAPQDPGSYSPSFHQNYRPQAAAPYLNTPYGPNLPHPPLAYPTPMSPGSPGWTTPPSLSGPHNPAGDPPRPGYNPNDIPMDFGWGGLTLNSYPQ
jgi:hypothetical protein